MTLNTLKKIIKNKKKIRVGRGIGSTKGKTSGRGHKGQKSRSGVAIKSFEGGQMPLYRRLPKRGFVSKKQDNIAILNLVNLQNLSEKKSLPEKDVINLMNLKKNKLISKKYDKLKVLGKGEIKEKISIEVNAISKSAKEKIEKIGGMVKLVSKKL